MIIVQDFIPSAGRAVFPLVPQTGEVDHLAIDPREEVRLLVVRRVLPFVIARCGDDVAVLRTPDVKVQRPRQEPCAARHAGQGRSPFYGTFGSIPARFTVCHRRLNRASPKNGSAAAKVGHSHDRTRHSLPSLQKRNGFGCDHPADGKRARLEALTPVRRAGTPTASSSQLYRPSRLAVSFSVKRPFASSFFIHSSGRFRSQRDVRRAHHPRRLEREIGSALKLAGKAVLDQSGAKTSMIGGRTGGPPLSAHIRRNCFCASAVAVISTRPVGFERAPYLTALCRVH